MRLGIGARPAEERESEPLGREARKNALPLGIADELEVTEKTEHFSPFSPVQIIPVVCETLH
jgi:hypothetical protein